MLMPVMAVILSVTAVSCDWIERSRTVEEVPPRHVFILYSVGNNDLSSHLKDDIEDMVSGYVPGRRDDRILLVVGQHAGSSSYTVTVNPSITRIYRNAFGSVIRDTVLVMDGATDTLTASSGMRKALSFIMKKYPCVSYGMMYSSHGTGWLPQGAYNSSFSLSAASADAMQYRPNVVFTEYGRDPNVKSMGYSCYRSGNVLTGREMEMGEIEEAIPMHLDYLLMDCCLMGCVEVAYQFRKVCHLIGFSQAEVLADGFDYKKLGADLLQGGSPDPQKVCEHYFEQYDSREGSDRSATISLVDCWKLDSLASCVASLWNEYGHQLSAVNPSSLQRYFRFGQHWYYDLEDIFIRAGIPAERLSALKDALDACVRYKAATPLFMNEFEIRHHCGLSMYFPHYGRGDLTDYYRTLDWNVATAIVK